MWRLQYIIHRRMWSHLVCLKTMLKPLTMGRYTEALLPQKVGYLRCSPPQKTTIIPQTYQENITSHMMTLQSCHETGLRLHTTRVKGSHIYRIQVTMNIMGPTILPQGCVGEYDQSYLLKQGCWVEVWTTSLKWHAILDKHTMEVKPTIMWSRIVGPIVKASHYHVYCVERTLSLQNT